MTDRILVIEDEAPLRAQVVEMLELEGFNVIEAENGGMAIGMLQNISPDIIICDIAMPDFDGYEVLKHVRQHDHLAQTPFIFVTARADRQSQRHGMDIGADDYLTKPFTRNELLASIQTRLERHKSRLKQSETDLDKAKKQLTHMVAHELRTPLTSVTMIHDLISNKLDDLSRSDLKGLLEFMESGNQRMRHLVDQMVLFTELNTGAMDETTIAEHGKTLDIQMVITESIEKGRKFAYRNQKMPIKRRQKKAFAAIHCLMNTLSFAIGELVTNALIYSPDNTSIIIEDQVLDNWVFVSIVDTGPGLTTNRLKQASMPFEQIDREKQEQQGMGMGIPLATRVIELHGGSVRIDTTASGGTRATVKLPRV